MPIASERTSDAEWSMLLFLAGDNNLSSAMVATLQRILVQNLWPRVAVLTELDPSGRGYPTQGYVFDDRDSEELSDFLAEEGPEESTGNPQALVEFAEWALKRLDPRALQDRSFRHSQLRELAASGPFGGAALALRFLWNPVNGFLSLHDIQQLELSAEVVVLSSCSTALGKNAEGEGLVGLVQGFMIAGAERVLASLWDVDDDATAALMEAFYRELLAADRSPTAALRYAQLSLMREPRWADPYSWAAFVSQGEWRHESQKNRRRTRELLR